MRFLALVQVEDDVPLAPCPWAPATSTVGLALWPAATDVANPPSVSSALSRHPGHGHHRTNVPTAMWPSGHKISPWPQRTTDVATAKPEATARRCLRRPPSHRSG